MQHGQSTLQHCFYQEWTQRLPVALAVDEVRRVIVAVEEPSRRIVKLLYNSGLRLPEALTLRWTRPDRYPLSSLRTTRRDTLQIPRSRRFRYTRWTDESQPP
jgi:integrase